jgi:Zinc knuckle
MVKDCPHLEKRMCHNCGSEDHTAKECDQPRNPATIQYVSITQNLLVSPYLLLTSTSDATIAIKWDICLANALLQRTGPVLPAPIATRRGILMSDASYPRTKRITRRSAARTLTVPLAEVGNLLMVMGVPLHIPSGRVTVLLRLLLVEAEVVGKQLSLFQPAKTSWGIFWQRA